MREKQLVDSCWRRRMQLLPLTLSAAFEMYFQAHVRTNCKPKTVREWERIFANNLAHLHERKLSSLTTAELSRLLADLAETPALAQFALLHFESLLWLVTFQGHDRQESADVSDALPQIRT